MGVDFITCENPACRYNFPDCGDFNYCYGCSAFFCSNCGDIEYDEDDDESSTCILCRKEVITSDDLVRFLLAKFGLTHDQAVDMFRKESKD